MSDLFNLAENFAKSCEQTATNTEKVANDAITKLEKSLILDLERSGNTIRNAITESEETALILAQRRGLIEELKQRQLESINNMNQHSEQIAEESLKAQALMLEVLKSSQEQLTQNIKDTNSKYRKMILGGWKYLAYTIGGVVLLALIVIGGLGYKISNQMSQLNTIQSNISESKSTLGDFNQRIENLSEKVYSCTDKSKVPFACVEVLNRKITTQNGMELIEINLSL